MTGASRPRAKLLLLALARALGVFALARRLTSKRLRILCYHGGCLGDESEFNPKLFSHARLITSRLRWLRVHGYTPMRLDEAVAQLNSPQTQNRLAVVITVDDGWFSSRAHILEPALNLGFPVTLYLATEVMQRQTPVLDVTLRYIVWRAGPVTVSLQGLPGLVDGHYDLSQAPMRAELVRAMLSRLRALGDDTSRVHETLACFAQAVGVSPEQLALDSRRFSYLTGEEIQQLHGQGCDVQLHGHTHLYPMGNPDALADDVQRCSLAIVGLGLPMPRHYCYPSGEFDANAPDLLAGLGVASATTCVPGLVQPGPAVQAHLLPRFLDGEDVHALEFEAEMSGLLAFARELRGAFRGRAAVSAT